MGKDIEIRPIPSYPEWFARSDGVIISRLGRELRGYWNKNRKGSAYLCVLCPGRKCRPVHALVLEAFVGPRPTGMQCLHRDDDRTNNKLSNLRWGTCAENARDKIRNGNAPHGESHGMHKLTEANVVEIRSLLRRGTKQRDVAKMFVVSHGNIAFIARGKTWARSVAAREDRA